VFAFTDDGVVEFGAEAFRKFVQLVIAVNLNCLLGCIHHHEAVMAPMEMLFQLGSYLHLDCAIQIIS
jgi:hypothetical protein